MMAIGSGNDFGLESYDYRLPDEIDLGSEPEAKVEPESEPEPEIAAEPISVVKSAKANDGWRPPAPEAFFVKSGAGDEAVSFEPIIRVTPPVILDVLRDGLMEALIRRGAPEAKAHKFVESCSQVRLVYAYLIATLRIEGLVVDDFTRYLIGLFTDTNPTFSSVASSLSGLSAANSKTSRSLSLINKKLAEIESMVSVLEHMGAYQIEDRTRGFRVSISDPVDLTEPSVVDLVNKAGKDIDGLRKRRAIAAGRPIR